MRPASAAAVFVPRDLRERPSGLPASVSLKSMPELRAHPRDRPGASSATVVKYLTRRRPSLGLCFQQYRRSPRWVALRSAHGRSHPKFLDFSVHIAEILTPRGINTRPY